MKKILLIALALISSICSAQTFTVNNLAVNGTSGHTGQATFTLSPTMPTPTAGDSSTKGATTAFVGTALLPFAPLASPVFTGAPAINGAAGSNRTLFFETSGLARWALYADGTAESGSNAGSNLGLNAYNDDGSYRSTPLTVNRASGLFSVTALSATAPNPALNYQAAGTGGAARSYAAKFADWVSVKDYGAVGNGIANDTTAINNAIAAACGTGAGNTPGGGVYLPAGNYLVTNGSINITQSNCFLWGAGQNATIITPAGTTGDVIEFSATTNNGIARLRINYPGAAPSSGAALHITGSEAVVSVYDLDIYGAFRGISDDASGGNHWYTNLIIYNSVASTGIAMTFSGFGNDDYLKNITINAPAGSQPAVGIQVVNNGGIWIDSVDVIHSTIGLYLSPSAATDSITWAFISNSAFDTNSNAGIVIQGFNASAVVKGINFVNSWSSSNGNQGVLIQGIGIIDGVRFVGHRSFNNGDDGIVATGSTVNNIEINDSDILGNSQSSSGTFSGISMAISNFMITGCRSGSAAQFPSSQKYGVLVQAGAFNNYIISNNNTQGNATGGIQDGGTGGTKVVANNL